MSALPIANGHDAPWAAWRSRRVEADREGRGVVSVAGDGSEEHA
ncbi:hypothetical protein [Microbacterium sp. P03]